MTHVIDIFTSEDMENISLCISQYLDHSLLYNKMQYGYQAGLSVVYYSIDWVNGLIAVLPAGSHDVL